MRSILDTINEHISDVNQVLTKSLPKKIASDLSQLEPLDVRYSVYVKKLFDEVFVEIEKLQKSKYIIETNEFIWAVWMLEENGSKVNIIIKTIFRGELKHTVVQERIRIRANGNVEKNIKRLNNVNENLKRQNF